ncbi:MAG: hypothetical protein ACI86C_000280, partial [Candidatus Latescibacterota bacterium]
PGIFYSYSGSQLIISGLPTVDVSVPQTYTYTITTIGQECDNTIVGDITIIPDDEISLVSGIGTQSQEVCENSPILDIVYELTGGSLGATVTGLPAGVSYNLDNSTGVLLLTISGAPIGATGIYSYDITTFGLCLPTTASGTIEIFQNGIITHDPASGATSQVLCQYAELDTIYFYIENALGVDVTGLPAGCDYTAQLDPATNIFEVEIFGSPLQTGVFTYAVEVFGSCLTEFTGVIEVFEGSYFELLSGLDTVDQVVCEDAEIEPIIYQIGGFYDNFFQSGLPNGIDAVLNPATGIVTISGSYAGPELIDSQTFQFTLFASSTNGCLSQIEGQITFYPTIAITDPVVVTEMSTNPTSTEIKHVYCNGASDGEINVVVEGGSPNAVYSVSWTGPDSFTSSNLNIDNLAPGTYTITILDITNENGCGVTSSFEILESDALLIDLVALTPPSCDTSLDDGAIQVSISGGNQNLVRTIDWYYLGGTQSCFNYSISPLDQDGDNIPDYADADIDGDGVIDPTKSDTDLDDIFDSADADVDGDGIIDPGKFDNNNDGIDDTFLITSVNYLDCETGLFDSIIIFNSNFIGSNLIICAGLNTPIVEPTLDHDLDPNTPDIPALILQGGTNTCNAGTWELLPEFTGMSSISDLREGLYKVVVSELNQNLNLICSVEEIFELIRDSISYDNLSVDSNLCEFLGGYLTVDVYTNDDNLMFFYNGQMIPLSDIVIIDAIPGRTTYQVFISNPVDNAPLEIINEFGCGVLVDEIDMDWAVPSAEFQYFSPEYDQFGIISIGSFISFEASYQMASKQYVWDFGDGSPAEYGPEVSHAFALDGTYQVTLEVFSAAGCSTTSTQDIVIGKGYTIMLPNVFTPNSDNLNDFFRPLFTGGIIELNFQVFDPDGNELYFETATMEEMSDELIINGWSGDNAKESTSYYVYKVQATLFSGNEVSKTGLFKLLK